MTNLEKLLYESLRDGLREYALNCNFGAQADDPAVCCCGKSKFYHWKVDARAAIAEYDRQLEQEKPKAPY